MRTARADSRRRRAARAPATTATISGGPTSHAITARISSPWGSIITSVAWPG